MDLIHIQREIGYWTKEVHDRTMHLQEATRKLTLFSQDLPKAIEEQRKMQANAKNN